MFGQTDRRTFSASIRTVGRSAPGDLVAVVAAFLAGRDARVSGVGLPRPVRRNGERDLVLLRLDLVAMRQVDELDRSAIRVRALVDDVGGFVERARVRRRRSAIGSTAAAACEERGRAEGSCDEREGAHVVCLRADDLNLPAPVALAVELDEEDALPGSELELAVPDRNGFTRGAEQHRHAV